MHSTNDKMYASSQQSASGGVVLNRKATKIEFLSQENQQLREQVSELQEIIQLNKEVLKIAFSSEGNNISFSSNNNDTSFNNSTKKNNASFQSQSKNDYKSTASESSQNKAMSLVLEALYKENEIFSKANERLMEERNIAQSKALINEQISEASEKHEKELLQDLEEKVKNLSSKVKDQEQIIYNYEKTKPEYDEISGIVIKYRDVININDQTIRMHDEIEKLNLIISKQSSEINLLKESKENLARLNIQLSNELIRLKSALAAPLGRSCYSQIVNQPTPDNYSSAKEIIKTHKKMMKDDNNSEFGDEQDHDDGEDTPPLPDKACQYMATEGSQNKPPPLTIPKLDLVKALKIQEINAKKSTMQQLQKQSGSDIGAICQQLKKAESDLTIAKKNLQREMLFNKTLQIENENLKRMTMDIQGKNDILIQSHQMYEQRWKQIYFAFCYYRDFHKKSKFQNQNGSSLCTCQISSALQLSKYSQRTQQLLNMNSTYSHIHNKSQLDPLNSSCYNGTTLNRYLSQHQQQNTQSNLNSNITNFGPYLKSEGFPQKNLLEINNNDLNLDEDAISKQDNAFQKEFERDFLLSMAKDVYSLFSQTKDSVSRKNKKKKIDSVYLIENKLKRSFSNPLEYVRDEAQLLKSQNQNAHLDKSDIGGRNFLLGEGDRTFDQTKSKKQFKDLNEALQSNQEILIQFTDDK